MAEEVKGQRQVTTANSPANAIMFAIEQFLLGKVNTALPVKVVGVNPGARGVAGTVDVLPLIPHIDGQGNAQPNTTIYNVPYSRLQGGKAAIIVDPVEGDLGAVVCAQRDISSFKANRGAANPGSFRSFDLADAMYVGFILNQAPEIFLELTQEGTATLKAPTKVIVDCPESEFTGNVFVQGNVTWAGVGQGQGGPAKFSGGITDNGVNVGSTHVHNGVEPGNSSTGGPQ